MRLFDRHTIQVQKRTTRITAAGTVYVNDGDLITVPCDFRYVSSDEMVNNGVVVQYVARVLVQGTWGFGINAQIVHNGQVFEIEGLPVVRDGSRRTMHTQVNLRYVGEQR